MDFESPDVMKEFPGLYASDLTKKHTNESDYSDDAEKIHKKDILIGKRKDKKDKKDKERGYAALEGESSPDENEARSPSKSKKSKSFKFTTSKSKEKRDKSREKDKDVTDRKKDKDKKTEKKGDKIKGEKKERKLKHGEEHLDISEGLPIFGVSLNTAVERSRCHDGVDIPLPVRLCIDYVEAHGLSLDGVYKVSGTKSKVLHLRKMFNHRNPVDFTEYDVPTVTSLLKMFIRDLPEPIFTSDLLIRFEEAGAILNIGTREKHLKILVDNLAQNNHLLLSWLLIHFDNIALNERHNKMNIQSVVAALSPCLHTSHRLLTALLYHCRTLFPNVTLYPYVPPLTSTAQLPDEPDLMEIELKKQESLLSQIHTEMNAGFISDTRQEMLWEVQRIITQLKRKLKIAQKESEKPDKPKEDKDQSSRESSKEPACKENVSKETFAKENFTKESFSKETFPKESFSKETFPNETFSRETFSKDSYAKEASLSEPGFEEPPFSDQTFSDLTPKDHNSKEEKTGEEISLPESHSPTDLDMLDNLENVSDVATIASEDNIDCEESLNSVPMEEEIEPIVDSASDYDDKNPIDESISLLQLKLGALIDLKDNLTKEIDVERIEIMQMKKQLKSENNVGPIPVLNEANMSNLDKIMDLLYKENQILQIKKINLVRQIMEQREICIDLRAKLELLSM